MQKACHLEKYTEKVKIGGAACIPHITEYSTGGKNKKNLRNRGRT